MSREREITLKKYVNANTFFYLFVNFCVACSQNYIKWVETVKKVMLRSFRLVFNNKDSNLREVILKLFFNFISLNKQHFLTFICHQIYFPMTQDEN